MQRGTLLLTLVILMTATRNNFVQALIFLDRSRERTLSVLPGSCHVDYDSTTISWMTEREPYGAVSEIATNELDYMVDACRLMHRPQNRPSLFIYPGTKWCGSGNLAHGYNDLGPLRAEDRCCREHDYCPTSLRAGQCRNGICNPSTVTRSHCECDLQFSRCLRQVDSAASHALGALYFNIARLPCFSEQPRPPQRRNARFFGCRGPYCDDSASPRYQYHKLAPYSTPFFGFSNPTLESVVPTAFSSVLLTVFKFIGVA